MKSLMLLAKNILHDCSIHCSTTTTRDFNTITRRVEKEGLSFLTITLSDYAKDFEQALEHGQILPGTFRSFRKVGPIPCLFKGMVLQVFDETGSLLNEPSVVAIRCIRQICLMWKKILLPCTKARESAAIDSYIECERQLSMLFDSNMSESEVNAFPHIDRVGPFIYLLDRPTLGPRHSKWMAYETSRFCWQSDSEKLVEQFTNVSNLIWGNILPVLDDLVKNGGLIPKHGAGAVATKVLPNQKYNWSVWHHRLEPYFPSSDFCYYNSEAFVEAGSELTYATPELEQPVRVVMVPKTLKTPRVIAVEPACMQYTQQSLLIPLVQILERHPLTRGHLNFTDQTVNAKLALTNSKSCILATLDLSEASDRVHRTLGLHMFSCFPDLRNAVDACRSSRATLPTGVTLQLEKFASMGSALCFPVESMVFFTILVLSEIRRLKLSLSIKSVKLVSRSIYVYGDDLIVPVDGVQSAISHLEFFGLKVNARKSFSKGNFRESCGMDAYSGIEVTPSYVRRKLPRSRRDVEG